MASLVDTAQRVTATASRLAKRDAVARWLHALKGLSPTLRLSRKEVARPG